MFKLHLYTVSSEVNRVDKSSELSDDFTLNGTLKDDCSIIDPFIVVAADATIVNFNYAYVEEFKRYYFINNITALNDGMWELSMHVDVLMSFKTDLLKLNAFIARNENDYDKYLVDREMPILGIPTITETKIGNVPIRANVPAYKTNTMLVVVASNVTDGTKDGNDTLIGGLSNPIDEGVQYQDIYGPAASLTPWTSGNICLIMSKEEYQNLAAYIQGSTETFVRDSIIAVYSIPRIEAANIDIGLTFDPVGATYGILQYTTADGTEHIAKYKSKDTIYRAAKSSGYIIKDNYFLDNSDDFLGFSPYTEFTLLLPFAGEFIIPSNMLCKLGGYLDIISAIDWTDATIAYIIFVGGYYAGTVSGQFGSAIPLQKSDMTEVNAVKRGITDQYVGNVISNLISTMATTGGNIIDGKWGSAAASPFVGIGNLFGDSLNFSGELKKITPSTQLARSSNLFLSSFNSSDIIVRMKQYKPTISTNEEIKFYASLRGRPLMNTRALNDIHGYTVVGDIHLDGVYATSTEKDEIDSKLKSGVILP